MGVTVVAKRSFRNYVYISCFIKFKHCEKIAGKHLIKSGKGDFQKNEVFFNIKAERISFLHIRSHLYLKCVL